MALSLGARRQLMDGLGSKKYSVEIADAIDNAIAGVVPADSISNAELAVDVKVGSLAALVPAAADVTTALNAKADKIVPALVNNIAMLNATGNLADSAVPIADIALKMVETGTIGTALFSLTDNTLVAGDTVVIGGDTYEFDGVGVNINVVVAGAPAGTRANLITAINTLGSENVFADEVGTNVRIRNANAIGGTPVVGTVNAILARTIANGGAAAADLWNQANLNATGHTAVRQMFPFEITIADVAGTSNLATDFFVGAPFTVTRVVWWAFDANGELVEGSTARVIVSAGDVLVNANNGATPLAIGDIVKGIAFA